jgi:hypothetical protein
MPKPADLDRELSVKISNARAVTTRLDESGMRREDSRPGSLMSGFDPADFRRQLGISRSAVI